MRTTLFHSLKLPLRARLAIVMAVSALGLALYGLWSLSKLAETSAELQQLATVQQRASDETAKLKETLAERHALLAKLRQAYSDGSEDSRLLLQTKLNGLNELIAGQSATLLSRTTQGLSTDAQDQFRYHTALYLSYQKQLVDSLNTGNLNYADRNLSQMLTPSYLQIEQQLGKVAQLQQAQQQAAIVGIAQKGQAQRTMGIVLLVLAGLLLISMPVVLFWGVIRRLRIIQPILERLQRGELSEVALPEGSDEVGKIAKGINTVSHNLAQAASFAHAVGQNRFDTHFEAAGENDLLGSALVDMRDRLRDVAEDEARRSWAIKGMAQFGEILRAHQDLDTFADQIISNLTRYIDGVQGAFFILQDEQQGKQRLKLMGCYAYDRKKYKDATFDLGEGLAGQAALERSTIYITEVPQNYVAITSGLGQANPQAILVVPLISNDTLFGVLEFAAFRHFPAHVIEFVEKLAENIASTLTHVKNNARTMVLLEETQRMTEALRANEEELRQNMEELHATHEEMKRVQLEMQGQVSAMNNAALVSEADLKGDIIYCNDTFCLVAKYGREELMGRNHRILKSGHQPQELFENLWATISRGQVWKGEVKNRAKDGTYYWVAATITPVLGTDSKPLKYIGVRFDITLQKEQEAMISQQLEEAQAQEEELRQNSEEMAAQQEEMVRIQMELEGQLTAINRSNAVIEFDTQGNILAANPNFLKVMGYNLEEIKGKHHSIFMNAVDAKSDDYAQHWSRLAKGEFLAGEFRRRAKNGDEIWIMGSYNPIFNKDGVVYKVIKFASDITLAKQQEALIRQTLEEVQAQEEELRQNAEEMAAQQEEMARVQLELKGQVSALNSAALVSEADVKGDIIYCNDTFCQVAKYERSELIGNNHRMLKSGHQPQALFEDMWATISQGKVWRGEVKNRAKDGSYYWVAATISPVVGNDGKPLKYIGVRFDITAQKTQEEQMRQILEETQAQEEELRQNAEEMAAQQEEMARLSAELEGQLKAINRSTAVVEFDTKGNIIQANERFLSVMGYKLEEIQGRHHRLFVDNSEAVSDAYRAFWEKLQQGEFVTGEFRRIAKDGSTRWIQGSYYPVFNSEGVLYKVVKFASDITEAKMQDLAIEEELNRARQAEAQLRAELQSLHKQALIEICANGEIGAVSADLLKLAGYEAQELTGQPLSTLTGGDAQSANALYTQLASQQSAQQNFPIITKSGQKLLLHGYFSKVQDKAQEKMIGMLHIN